MAFGNAKVIVQRVSGWTAIKLLLLSARFSRPALDPLCGILLRPFLRDGQISLRYREVDRDYQVFLRGPDQRSDLHSVMEVVVRRIYRLDPDYAADLVIDGGANIGLFALEAAAVYPAAKIIACEPLPRNVAQTEKHLELNHVPAEILPVCIGGMRRTIPFYCRWANASSFDGEKPYDSVMEIEVLRLKDILAERAATRILIKLDIEGMEVEALEAYVPGESRAVVILGELHAHEQTRPIVERLFTEHGWQVKFGDPGADDVGFEARSPAACK